MMACTIENYSHNNSTFFLSEDPFLVDTSVQWGAAAQMAELNINPAVPDPFSKSSSGCSTPTLISKHASRLPSKPFFATRQHGVANCTKAPAWWESHLAVQIHETLMKRETALAKIQLKSPQLDCRKSMVDFITSVCRHLEISIGTRYLAVRLMDHFMDGHNVMQYRLRLMSLTCLLLAAKFEEPEDHLPSIEMLQHAACIHDVSSTYIREEFHTLELYMLKYFKWSVSHPTTAHLIDYYLLTCMKDVQTDLAQWEVDIIRSQMQDFATFFMESSLRDHVFLHYKPSEMAAAIVCVARISCRIGTAWSTELQKATSYSLEHLQPIANNLLNLLAGGAN